MNSTILWVQPYFEIAHLSTYAVAVTAWLAANTAPTLEHNDIEIEVDLNTFLHHRRCYIYSRRKTCDTLSHQLKNNLEPRTENTKRNFLSPSGLYRSRLVNSLCEPESLFAWWQPLAKNLKAFYGSVLALFSQETVNSPCWARWSQPTSLYPLSLRFILKSNYLCFNPHKRLFPSGFATICCITTVM
jgi:hypothetical protein